MEGKLKKNLLLFFIISQFLILNGQTITGKLVDHEGNGLSDLQLKLYVSPKTYDARSNTDGSFTFLNITGVEKNDLLPAGYSVSENYPNPFNPKTRIEITVPIGSHIKLDVFNILGQQVLKEIGKFIDAGISYVDLELSGLPNGTYLVRINVDERYSVIKKIMLIYGSQHLSLASEGRKSYLQKINTTIEDYSTLNTRIDSLIVKSPIIGEKVFKSLPSIDGNTLDLGNLIIERFCPGIPSISYAGKTYNTIQISSQCWLKENLDVGIMIPAIKNASNNTQIEKYCFNNDPGNCTTYGGLYQWDEAMAYISTAGSKGICPDGWHVPTFQEFVTLESTVDYKGNTLKKWGSEGGNTSGFSALLAGNRSDDTQFFKVGTYFWASTFLSADNAYVLTLYDDNRDEVSIFNTTKKHGFSIRCIKD